MPPNSPRFVFGPMSRQWLWNGHAPSMSFVTSNVYVHFCPGQISSERRPSAACVPNGHEPSESMP
jgi:hypothetical protein